MKVWFLKNSTKLSLPTATVLKYISLLVYRNIPIENVYYMLSYAWQFSNNVSLQWSKVTVTESNNASINLLCKLLHTCLQHITQLGLLHQIAASEQTTSLVKGKINWKKTIATGNIDRLLLNSSYNTSTSNNTINQYLKRVVYKLTLSNATPTVFKPLFNNLSRQWYFIDDVPIETFDVVRTTTAWQSLPNYYKTALHIAYCINQNLQLKTYSKSDTTNWTWLDFTANEAQMASIYEHFIYNFYKQHLNHHFLIHRPYIKWMNTPDQTYLPLMRTDMYVANSASNYHCILDTKFTANSLQHFFNTPKIRSAHLYQLFAYLKNLPTTDAIQQKCEGILLYPQINEPINISTHIDGYPIKLRTINLNQHWRQIGDDLLAIFAMP